MMSDDFLKAFDEFLRHRSPRFVCEDVHSGRTPNPRWIAPVVHRMNPPATAEAIEWAERELDIKLPASYRHFLMQWNGGVLFDQDWRRLGLPVADEPEGVAFYPIEEIPKQTRAWRAEWTEVLHHDMSLKPPKRLRISVSEFLRSKAERIERDLERVPGIVVIGENLKSGNYFGFDLTPPQLTNESPVIFLQHEGCSVSNPDILGDNSAIFVQRFVTDSVTMLRGNMWCVTRYCDG